MPSETASTEAAIEKHESAFLHPKSTITSTGHGNRVILLDRARAGQPGRIKGLRIELLGNNNTLILHPYVQLKAGHYRLSGEGATLEFGRGTTVNGAYFLCDNAQIRLGEDCMLSYGIEFRTTDAHSIRQHSTGKLLNPPEGIAIGDHCWIGKEACIMKGVSLADNIIVGTRALVTKSFGVPYTALAGVPAKQVSEDVEWHRAPPLEG